MCACVCVCVRVCVCVSQIATATKMIQNIGIRSIGMNNPLINIILKRS